MKPWWAEETSFKSIQSSYQAQNIYSYICVDDETCNINVFTVFTAKKLKLLCIFRIYIPLETYKCLQILWDACNVEFMVDLIVFIINASHLLMFFYLILDYNDFIVFCDSSEPECMCTHMHTNQ